MPIFATPDFGASGVIVLIVLVVWLVVLIAVTIGLVKGWRLLHSEQADESRRGLLILLVSIATPLCCCQGPQYLVRIAYGNFPLGRYPNNMIEEGMTSDQVRALLGSPHERVTGYEGTEHWYYWIDSFGVRYFAVSFNSASQVDGTGGN